MIKKHFGSFQWDFKLFLICIKQYFKLIFDKEEYAENEEYQTIEFTNTFQYSKCVQTLQKHHLLCFTLYFNSLKNCSKHFTFIIFIPYPNNAQTLINSEYFWNEFKLYSNQFRDLIQGIFWDIFRQVKFTRSLVGQNFYSLGPKFNN